MSKHLLIRPYIYQFICPSFHPSPFRTIQPVNQPMGWLAWHQVWLSGPQVWLAGPQAMLDGPEGGTDKQTNEQTENLPILQDFIPYPGCCPKTLVVICQWPTASY